MDEIRSFVAVLISPELKSRIGKVQETFKALPCDVKWVAEDNLHITLKFLGNVREDEIEAVCAAVEQAAGGGPPAFELAFSGVGAFPNARRPQVIWVGTHKGGEEMAGLAERLEEALAPLGFERERKRFNAHVTIGRVRSPRGLDALAKAIQSAAVEELGSQTVNSVAIMKSDLRPTGPIYSIIREFRLGGG